MKTNLSNWHRLLAVLVACAGCHAAAVFGAADQPEQRIHPGVFEPSWESLEKNYQVPEWYRDAKFGIWAHWGPQCQPEQGDWYARNMYIEGSPQYQHHLQTRGHPSKTGFKDIIHDWKAERFDPDKLMALYQRAGARYFVMMANHHCNFDNFDSRYQPWNSVNLGPKKDLVGLWAKAARQAGLRFGVTVHSARAWTWYEVAQGADKRGPLEGVPYDGKLTKADGKGQWWDGYDPQDLYAQNHPVGARPDSAYIRKFFLRTKDLIDQHKPDLLYFDDSVLPLQNAENVGLRLAAHFYNANASWHAGRNEAILTTKRLEGAQRRALVWDIERGASSQLEPFPWQTDTCIGTWHYNRPLFERHGYKSAATVITMLIDIVSKNGNLLLSVPLRGDGTLDEDEIQLLESLGRWMAVNGEGIFGTRPWKVFGEGGPLAEASASFNERTRRSPTADDIRYTVRGDTLYAFCLGLPARDVRMPSLGSGRDGSGRIESVQLLGSTQKVEWKQESDALVIQRPEQIPCEHAIAFKIALAPFRAEDREPARNPDVVYVPTPQEVVDKMLELAEIKPGDVVYDLGCGDGRIVVTAAKRYGVKAYGFDINPERIQESLANVKANGVEHLVTIREADIFTLDLREANVVTLYLLPELNVRLMPQLAQLKPGSRIVSHDFDMRGAKPRQVHHLNLEGDDPDDSGYYEGEHTIYQWIVPWEKENGR
ncbi:MAG: alpha-L-fucosidase [Verrucomicrobia bacterium]|nr:alpha-L-fucosidase [Verrucomicrobiota bacterium]